VGRRAIRSARTEIRVSVDAYTADSLPVNGTNVQVSAPGSPCPVWFRCGPGRSRLFLGLSCRWRAPQCLLLTVHAGMYRYIDSQPMGDSLPCSPPEFGELKQSPRISGCTATITTLPRVTPESGFSISRLTTRTRAAPESSSHCCSFRIREQRLYMAASLKMCEETVYLR
jgi:hypothetical protein